MSAPTTKSSRPPTSPSPTSTRCANAISRPRQPIPFRIPRTATLRLQESGLYGEIDARRAALPWTAIRCVRDLGPAFLVVPRRSRGRWFALPKTAFDDGGRAAADAFAHRGLIATSARRRS